MGFSDHKMMDDALQITNGDLQLAVTYLETYDKTKGNTPITYN